MAGQPFPNGTARRRAGFRHSDCYELRPSSILSLHDFASEYRYLDKNKLGRCDDHWNVDDDASGVGDNPAAADAVAETRVVGCCSCGRRAPPSAGSGRLLHIAQHG